MAALIIRVLKIYKLYISWIFGQNCRFYPSCSEYCAQAIARYGVLRGVFFGILRVCKCNPWSAGGCDPVVRIGREKNDK